MCLRMLTLKNTSKLLFPAASDLKVQCNQLTKKLIIRMATRVYDACSVNFVQSVGDNKRSARKNILRKSAEKKLLRGDKPPSVASSANTPRCRAK